MLLCCLRNGAWGTYRACSSRFSVGCNDLICHPGVSLICELELRAGLEPASMRFAGAAAAVPVTATFLNELDPLAGISRKRAGFNMACDGARFFRSQLPSRRG